MAPGIAPSIRRRFPLAANHLAPFTSFGIGLVPSLPSDPSFIDAVRVRAAKLRS